MQRLFGVFLLFALFCCGAINAAEPIATSDPYYEDIFRGLGIDPNSKDVWASGSREYITARKNVGINAYYKKAPRLLDDELCAIEVHQRRAEIDNGIFSWSDESHYNRVWLSPTQDCEFTMPYTEPPSVWVAGDVTFEEASYMLWNDDYIFQKFLAILRPGQNRGWSTHKLMQVFKTDKLMNVNGEFLGLRFESPAGVGSGRTVFIQLRGDEIAVETYGFWDGGFPASN